MVPPPVDRISGSLPTFPNKKTLFTLFAISMPSSCFFHSITARAIGLQHRKRACGGEFPLPLRPAHYHGRVHVHSCPLPALQHERFHRSTSSSRRAASWRVRRCPMNTVPASSKWPKLSSVPSPSVATASSKPAREPAKPSPTCCPPCAP